MVYVCGWKSVPWPCFSWIAWALKWQPMQNPAVRPVPVLIFRMYTTVCVRVRDVIRREKRMNPYQEFTRPPAHELFFPGLFMFASNRNSDMNMKCWNNKQQGVTMVQCLTILSHLSRFLWKPVQLLYICWGNTCVRALQKFEMKYVLRTTISIWIKVCYDHAMFYIWNVYIYFHVFAPFLSNLLLTSHVRPSNSAMCVLPDLLCPSILFTYVCTSSEMLLSVPKSWSWILLFFFVLLPLPWSLYW